jgi:hypothetical protein
MKTSSGIGVVVIVAGLAAIAYLLWNGSQPSAAAASTGTAAGSLEGGGGSKGGSYSPVPQVTNGGDPISGGGVTPSGQNVYLPPQYQISPAFQSELAAAYAANQPSINPTVGGEIQAAEQGGQASGVSALPPTVINAVQAPASNINVLPPSAIESIVSSGSTASSTSAAINVSHASPFG